jgi:hypothetical protein
MQNLLTKPSGHPNKLLNRLLFPQLDELTPKELLDRFVKLGQLIDQCIERRGTLEELCEFQLQLTSLKDEIHRKANLPAKSPFQQAYATLYLS